MVRTRSFWTGLGFGLILGSMLLQLLSLSKANVNQIDPERLRAYAEQEGYLLQPAHERWYTASELEAAIEDALAEQQEEHSAQRTDSGRSDTGNTDSGLTDSDRAGSDRSDFERSETNEIALRSLLIPPGTTSEQVADMLLQLELIEDRDQFLREMTRRNQHRSIRSGVYEFEGDPELEEIIEAITP